MAFAIPTAVIPVDGAGVGVGTANVDDDPDGATPGAAGAPFIVRGRKETVEGRVVVVLPRGDCN